MRNTLVLIIVLVVLIASPASASEYPWSIEDAVESANSEIGFELYKLNHVNEAIWKNYGFLVYGEPFGEVKGNEYRYLGFSPLGDKVPNPQFPDDDPASTLINNWDWIKYPWDSDLGSRHELNNDPDLLPKIREALKQKYGQLFDETDTKQWQKYALVIQPWTKYTPGLGRMWHLWDSNGDGKKETWYITFVIPADVPRPQLPDLYVKEIIPAVEKVEPGKEYNAAVTYGLDDNYDKPLTAKLGLTHNGSSISGIDGKLVDFQPGEEKTFNFTFTGQSGGSNLQAKIWPVAPTAEDKDWTNNSKSLALPSKEAKEANEAIDLSADLIAPATTIDSGNGYQYTALIGNSSDKQLSSTVVWRVNGQVQKTETVNITAKGTYSQFTLYVPASAATGTKYNLEVEVNPDRKQPPGEPVWSNNIDRVTVEAYKDVSEDSNLSDVIITK
ncbi:MAG: hypothetical protein H0Z24_03480 [Thermosipho sp. (in: Bacteria)]|nr:hypothetical protein [Thermosipho sp. (in: thermotogales)]